MLYLKEVILRSMSLAVICLIVGGCVTVPEEYRES